VPPEALEKEGFVVVMAACGEVDQSARDQTKHADEVHRGKTAPGFLAGGLRPALLVFWGVGHGNPGAIDQLDVAAVPVRRVRNVFLHALDEVGVDLVDDALGNPGARPAIPGAMGADRAVFCAWFIAPDVGDERANRFAAGACRVEHLVKKAPEDHFQ
jgi:hypothetical protein